jgi:hypothetical protein
MSSITFIIGLISIGVSVVCFDYLRRFQFKHHRDLWIEDDEPTFLWGRPKGFFDYSFSSQIAGAAHSLRLVFGNPDWIKENKQLKRVAFIYRIGTILFWIMWLVHLTIIFNE